MVASAAPGCDAPEPLPSEPGSPILAPPPEPQLPPLPVPHPPPPPPFRAVSELNVESLPGVPAGVGFP